MADFAQGANCPSCGTLVAVSGNRADAELTGRCPVDGMTIQKANPQYDPKAAADQTLEQLRVVEQENADLKAQLAAAKAETPTASDSTSPEVATSAGNS